MARRKPSPRDDDRPLNHGERDVLEAHLGALAITDERVYLAWCREQGFPERLRKNQAERKRELSAARVHRTSEADRALAGASARRGPRSFIERLEATELDRLDPEERTIRELLGSLGRKPASRETFEALLWIARKQKKLYSAQPVVAEYPRSLHNTLLGALASLSTHHEAFIRSPETFTPRSKNARRMFGQLARHLLARYEVPAFMDTAWFKRSRTQGFWVHLAQGRNIRTAARPLVPLTRRMAHAFLQAPSSYTVEHAFRWAQVIGLGGNARVAEGVRGTRLGRGFKHDDFWSSVVRFFIANPLLAVSHYGPIVDYIHHQRFAVRREFDWHGQERTLPPPHPGFSMHRRTPENLLRQVEAWHRELGRRARRPRLAWSASGLAGSTFHEGRGAGRRSWSVEELCSSEALAEEGRVMRHCVASYDDVCASGREAIFSLRSHEPEGDTVVTRRELTIDVNLASRTIVEVRARFNALPEGKPLLVLRRWAAQAGLEIASWVEG